ncbi:MAG: hypothetical protein IJG87_06455 [Ruminococcus sp.]|nr:hypothetical protein [Ruminococcus sp.]
MNVFELVADIKLNDSEFKSSLSKTGKTIGKFAKVTGAALAAGGAAVVSLVTSSVRAYAEYEQLAGGVQKLFGKEAAQTMMQYAQQAYQTAGMSANQYLEQSTSFAAALIQSYGGDTAAAADQADKAMRAISDNFNTFGGDISSVQAAYQGFAKQNYTMLDNLKLGYGGTKTEMERLIADANEYAAANGKAADLSIENFGDIVEAINLIQEKQGIAGTTAKEASTTIAGSFAATKAAWKNLLVAFSDKDADLSVYFGALTDSAETAFMNILPVAEQALSGIGNVIANLAPVIGEKLPGLVDSVLPGIISAATGLVQSLATSLPQIIETLIPAIISALPQIIEAGITLFAGLVTGLINAIPQIVEALPAIWEAIKTGFANAWPAMKEAGIKLIHMVGEGISAAWGWIKGKASEVWDGIKASVSASWDGIKAKASDIWNGIKSKISGVWESITSKVTGAVNNVKSAVSNGFNAVKTKVSSVWDGIKSKISGVMDGIKEKIQAAVDFIKNIFNFSWSLPPLKLPKFSITGGFSLNPPSVPKLSVTWNRKALNEPFMFTEATLFGAGEAGDEVLYGKSNLMEDIRLATDEGNNALRQRVDAIVALLEQYLPEAVKPTTIDGDRLVGKIRTKMDNQLGELDGYGRRGLSLA